MLSKQNPFRCSFSLFVSFLVLALAFSCVSTSDESEQGEVLERSGTFRPLWAQGDFSAEGDGPKQIHFRKSGVYRLELGLKQAQAAGIEQSCELIQKRIQRELQSRAESGPWKGQAWISQIPVAVSKIASGEKCPEAQPKFVYWELLRKDTAEGPRETYTIDVLLAVKKVDYREALFYALSKLKAAEGKPTDGFVQEIVESAKESSEVDTEAQSEQGVDPEAVPPLD